MRYFTLVNAPLKIANLGYCKAMAKGGIQRRKTVRKVHRATIEGHGQQHEIAIFLSDGKQTADVRRKEKIGCPHGAGWMMTIRLLTNMLMAMANRMTPKNFRIMKMRLAPKSF